MKRNVEMHTSADQAKRNILVYLATGYPANRHPARKSVLGRVAFPGYDFKKPQGAAFAVAKLVRELEQDGLITHSVMGERGNIITEKGMAFLANQETK